LSTLGTHAALEVFRGWRAVRGENVALIALHVEARRQRQGTPMKSILSAVMAVALVAGPLAAVPSVAQAKTEKQLRDEAKGKIAKQKSAEKSASRKAAKKMAKK
jgi:hypothetical protein